jgi:hypothetical protein
MKDYGKTFFVQYKSRKYREKGGKINFCCEKSSLKTAYRNIKNRQDIRERKVKGS